MAPAAPSGVPPACGTTGGLDVQGRLLTVHGIHSYGHVCVLGGGRLRADAALTLRTGLLYVATGSSIVADGLPGGTPKTVDCTRTGTGKPDGAPGAPLTILANRAIVLGRISADGGEGYDGAASPCTKRDGGNGGDGGQITLETVRLTLHGSITANGGSGGYGLTPDPMADQFFETGGRAGSGGDGGASPCCSHSRTPPASRRGSTSPVARLVSLATTPALRTAPARRMAGEESREASWWERSAPRNGQRCRRPPRDLSERRGTMDQRELSMSVSHKNIFFDRKAPTLPVTDASPSGTAPLLPE